MARTDGSPKSARQESEQRDPLLETPMCLDMGALQGRIERIPGLSVSERAALLKRADKVSGDYIRTRMEVLNDPARKRLLRRPPRLILVKPGGGEEAREKARRRLLPSVREFGAAMAAFADLAWDVHQCERAAAAARAEGAGGSRPQREVGVLLTPRHRRVLTALHENLGAGKAMPSMRQLALDARVRHADVKRLYGDLLNHGLVRVGEDDAVTLRS